MEERFAKELSDWKAEVSAIEDIVETLRRKSIQSGNSFEASLLAKEFSMGMSFSRTPDTSKSPSGGVGNVSRSSIISNKSASLLSPNTRNLTPLGKYKFTPGSSGARGGAAGFKGK